MTKGIGLEPPEFVELLGSASGAQKLLRVTGLFGVTRRIGGAVVNATVNWAPVLVVEDDLDVREAFVDALEDKGFSVVTAGNGLEALRLLQAAEVQPSAIILDLMMPVMDGYSFLAEQKKDPALAGIPVAIVTAGYAVDKERLGEAPVLRKPVQLSELVTVIQNLQRPQKPAS